MEWLSSIWSKICDAVVLYLVTPFRHFSVLDAIDILLLAALLTVLYRFFRNRRAGRVLLGLVLFVIAGLIVRLCGFTALGYIVELFAAAAMFCVVVIFQPEIRDALEHLGNSLFLNPRKHTVSRRKYSAVQTVADEVTDAVTVMSSTRTGALIVVEGLTKLGDYMKTGTVIDAAVSSKLLQNIFFDKAPLHDGALIIRDFRVSTASCVLPSSKGDLNFGSMGTRHRAAVGVTEVSDALAIVVSEETGKVAVAQEGKLVRDVDSETLRKMLMTYLAGNAYLHKRKTKNIEGAAFRTPVQTPAAENETDASENDSDV